MGDPQLPQLPHPPPTAPAIRTDPPVVAAGTECAVCTEEVTNQSAILIMPCSHSSFCSGCIKAWQARKRSQRCPLCRTTIEYTVDAVDGVVHAPPPGPSPILRPIPPWHLFNYHPEYQYGYHQLLGDHGSPPHEDFLVPGFIHPHGPAGLAAHSANNRTLHETTGHMAAMQAQSAFATAQAARITAIAAHHRAAFAEVEGGVLATAAHLQAGRAEAEAETQGGDVDVAATFAPRTPTASSSEFFASVSNLPRRVREQIELQDMRREQRRQQLLQMRSLTMSRRRLQSELRHQPHIQRQQPQQPEQPEQPGHSEQLQEPQQSLSQPGRQRLRALQTPAQQSWQILQHGNNPQWQQLLEEPAQQQQSQQREQQQRAQQQRSQHQQIHQQVIQQSQLQIQQLELHRQRQLQHQASVQPQPLVQPQQARQNLSRSFPLPWGMYPTAHSLIPQLPSLSPWHQLSPHELLSPVHSPFPPPISPPSYTPIQQYQQPRHETSYEYITTGVRQQGRGPILADIWSSPPVVLIDSERRNSTSPISSQHPSGNLPEEGDEDEQEVGDLVVAMQAAQQRQSQTPHGRARRFATHQSEREQPIQGLQPAVTQRNSLVELPTARIDRAFEGSNGPWAQSEWMDGERGRFGTDLSMRMAQARERERELAAQERAMLLQGRVMQWEREVERRRERERQLWVSGRHEYVPLGPPQPLGPIRTRRRARSEGPNEFDFRDLE